MAAVGVQAAVDVVNAMNGAQPFAEVAKVVAPFCDKAANLKKCADILDNIPDSLLDSMGDVLDKSRAIAEKTLEQNNLPKEMAVKGKDGWRKGTADVLRNNYAQLLDIGLVLAEVAIICVEVKYIKISLTELELAGKDIEAIQSTLGILLETHFSDTASIEEMLASDTKRRQVKGQLERVRRDIDKAKLHLSNAESAGRKAQVASVGGMVLGGAMAAGYGATSLLARGIGAVGCAISGGALVVSTQQVSSAQAMRATLDQYATWIRLCNDLMESREEGMVISDEAKASFLKKSQALMKHINEAKAESDEALDEALEKQRKKL